MSNVTNNNNTEKKVNLFSDSLLKKVQSFTEKSLSSSGSKAIYKDTAKLKNELLSFADYKLNDNDKTFRNKMRKEKRDACLNVITSFKAENESSLKLAIKNFQSFYIQNFILNDYSLQSLTSSKKESNVIFFTTFLEVMQYCKDKI